MKKALFKALDHMFLLYIPSFMAATVLVSLIHFYFTLDDEIGGLFLNLAAMLAVWMIAGYIANTIASIIIHCRKEKEK